MSLKFTFSLRPQSLFYPTLDARVKPLLRSIIFDKNRGLIEARFIFLRLFNRLNKLICYSSHIIQQGRRRKFGDNEVNLKK